MHYINGAWVAGGSHRFISTNPANGEALWQGEAADAALVEQAVAAARDAINRGDFADAERALDRADDVIHHTGDECLILAFRHDADDGLGARFAHQDAPRAVQPGIAFFNAMLDALVFQRRALLEAHIAQDLRQRLVEREEALEKNHREQEQLQAAKHRAELAAEAERLHRTLLDSVSHELKTPIAIIRTALDGLGQGNPYAAEIGLSTVRVDSSPEYTAPLLQKVQDAFDAMAPADQARNLMERARAQDPGNARLPALTAYYYTLLKKYGIQP